MHLNFFTLSICLIISIHQIYEWLYFYRDMGNCDIYSRSEIFLGSCLY